MSEKKDIDNFEEDLKKLDNIIAKAEDEIDIEKTIDSRKKGNDILKNLKNILNSTEKKFSDFEKKINGEIKEKSKNRENFSESIEKLESIIGQMEKEINGSNNLKDCVSRCEQGLKIIKKLENNLKEAEKKIKNEENVINVD